MAFTHTRSRKSFTGKVDLALRRTGRLYFLLLGIFCIQLIIIPKVGEAATIAPETITGNVRWVPEKGPYIINQNTVVGRAATLTIAAGTEVRFRRSYSPKPYTNRGVLRVLGTLKVEGTAMNPVYFGLYEEGAMGDWGGIWIDGYNGGRVMMEHAEVERAQRGIFVSGGSPMIKHCRFSANLTGIWLEQTTGFLVEGNIISGNDYGLYLDSAKGTVAKNSIISNSWGIYSFLSQGVTIAHNAIKSNTFGIAFDGGLSDVVEYNDFSIRQPNDYGIYLFRGKPARVNYNNFFYDPEIVRKPSQVFWYVWNDDNAGEVNASHNWWDTTKPEIIEAYIMDKRDRSYLGLVNYLPMAGRPVSGTADDIGAPVVSIDSLRPFSPVASDKVVVTYALSKGAESLNIEVVDINGLMGPQSGTLFRYLEKGVTDPKRLEDGQHSWEWDGRLPGGWQWVDGIYRLEMVAMDKDVPGLSSETAGARFIVDSIPPVLKVDFPVTGYTLHDNTLDVRGRVEDANLMGGFVLVRETLSGSGGRATLQGNNWSFHLGRLREGYNELTIMAFDGADNMSQAKLTLIYDPVLDLRVTSPTNVNSQVIRGTIRDYFSGEITDVEVESADGGRYATHRVDTEFYTLEPVPLSLGDNLIKAIAYDGSGEQKGSVTAVIEYDPLYDIEVTGSFAPGLQMVSVPMQPFDDSPVAIFHSAPLAQWRVGAGGETGYVYEGEDLQRVTPYRGYWWKPAVARDVTARGKAYDPSRGFAFPLEMGWNQVGCPFLQSVEWENVTFRVDQGRALSLEEAVREGWISRGLWTYRDGGYVPSTTLRPWWGYWVLARRPLEVVIPPGAVRSTKAVGMLTEAKAMSTTSPTGGGGVAKSSGADGTNGWSMQLSLVTGKEQDRYNYLGVMPGLGSGFDPRYDLEKPPPVEGPSLWFSPDPGKQVMKRAGGKGNVVLGGMEARLASDYRGPNQSLVWDVYMQNNSDTDELILSWSGDWNVTEWQVNLLDPAVNTRTPLGIHGAINLSLAQGDTKHMQVEAIWESAKLTLSEVLPYPNPWDTSRPLRLGFTLNQGALVEARVYDVAGNLVKTLPSGKYGAGRHYLEWDGRNGRGRLVANGLYYYQVSARPTAGPGKTVKVQGRLAVLR